MVGNELEESMIIDISFYKANQNIILISFLELSKKINFPNNDSTKITDGNNWIHLSNL